MALKLERPPAVHLTEPPTYTMSSPPASADPSRSATPITEPDLLASLTLSSQPVITPPASKAIFGLPSFPVPSANPPSSPRPQRQPARTVSVIMADADDDVEEKDPDAMDWSPTKELTLGQGMDPEPTQLTKDEAWLRPQRFFAPEEPTGLENLFAKTIRLVDAEESANNDHAQDMKGKGPQDLNSYMPKIAWTRFFIFLVPLIPIVGVAYRIWERQKTQEINGYT